MMNKAVKHCFATQQPLVKRNVLTVNDEMSTAFSKASISDKSENKSLSSKISDSDSSSSVASSSSDE